MKNCRTHDSHDDIFNWTSKNKKAPCKIKIQTIKITQSQTWQKGLGQSLVIEGKEWLTKTQAFLTKRVKDENHSKQALAMEWTLTGEKYTS